jgi:hypothetical protein
MSRRCRAAASIAATLLLLAGETLADTVPRPFEPLTVRGSPDAVEVELWGRSYRFDSGPLPSQIYSQGTPLFAGRPRFAGADGAEVAWEAPVVLRADPHVVRLRSTGSLGSFRVWAHTQIEYDGMIAVKLVLSAPQAASVDRLEYEIALSPAAARFFVRHLPYDYQVANVDKEQLLEAAGTLPAGGFALDFVPTLALGNRQVGVEWWSETNAHWSLPAGARAFEVVPGPQAVRLRVTPIGQPLALTEGRSWVDDFALFVFPARPPPERWRSVRFLPYGRAQGFDPNVGTRFLFYATQSTFHARYDGLPGSTDDSVQRALRSELERRGVGYMPYGALTIAPLLNPRTMANLEQWSANGRWWRIPEGQTNPVIERTHPELGAGDPYTYPVCAARTDYFDWMLEENLATLHAEAPDALFFDHGAITRMCVSNPILEGKDGRESWEYRNVRDFYKRLYESVKAEAPDALVVIHTHGAPKALGAFVDFHVFGEALNAVFGGGRPSAEYFSEPSLYTPDYLALPQGYLAAQLFPPVGGVASLMPQIKWAMDPEDPKRARGFQRAFHAFVLANDAHAPLWSTEYETADAIYQALDRFGDLGSAVAFPAWSNARLIRRPGGLRVTAWARDGRALLVLANLSSENVQGRIELDLAGLSVPGATRYRDLEGHLWWSGRLQDDGFTLQVPPRDLRILLVE